MPDYPISPVVRRVVYTASAGVGPYAFTFEILTQTDIDVFIDSTLKTLTTDYTVTINANGTGSITFVIAPTATARVTIVGAREIQRATDFVTGGDLTASSLNLALDQNVIFAQQNAEALGRAILAPVTDPTSINMVLPLSTVRANKTLAFDSDGNPIIGEQIGDWKGNWAATTSYNKRDLVKDTTNDNVYICIVAHTSSGSLPITSNADSAKWDLVVDASAAAAAQAAAEAAQAAAEAAQTAAELAETNAETAETNAETAETNAEAAQTAAEAAQAAAESARDSTLAAFDSFDDRYLGTKTSDPTLDNDGNALVAGALYFNSVSGIMKVYTGSAWVAAYVSAEGLLEAANNLSDLASAPTALTNLGGTTVGKAVFTAATAAAAQQAMDVEVGVDVQAYDADTAKTDVAQTFTASQRGTVTTDNDGSFDLSVTNNFQCTPSGSITLTFTNRTAGQSGFILLINTGAHTVSAHADTEVSTTALATISAAGTYLLSYFATSTNVYVVNSGALA
jgi:hypothetical protein